MSILLNFPIGMIPHPDRSRLGEKRFISVQSFSVQFIIMGGVGMGCQGSTSQKDGQKAESNECLWTAYFPFCNVPEQGMVSPTVSSSSISITLINPWILELVRLAFEISQGTELVHPALLIPHYWQMKAKTLVASCCCFSYIFYGYAFLLPIVRQYLPSLQDSHNKNRVCRLWNSHYFYSSRPVPE